MGWHMIVGSQEERDDNRQRNDDVIRILPFRSMDPAPRLSQPHRWVALLTGLRANAGSFFTHKETFCGITTYVIEISPPTNQL